MELQLHAARSDMVHQKRRIIARMLIRACYKLRLFGIESISEMSSNLHPVLTEEDMEALVPE